METPGVGPPRQSPSASRSGDRLAQSQLDTRNGWLLEGARGAMYLSSRMESLRVRTLAQGSISTVASGLVVIEMLFGVGTFGTA